MRIKVGLAQIYPKLGDLAYNLQAHLDYVRQAREQKVDLLVFPELSLTGYQVQDLVPEVAIETDAKSEVFAALLKASAEIDIVVGFVHRDRRKRFYIARRLLVRRRSAARTSQTLPAHLRHVRRIALFRAGQQRARL